MCALHRFSGAALAAALGVAACTARTVDRTDETPAPLQVTTDQAGARVFVDPVSHVRFAAPPPAFTPKALHFDPKAKPSKVRHSFTLSAPTGPAPLRIDVWDDPENLELPAWFDRHLRHLENAATSRTYVPASRRKVSGLVLDIPASPQAFAGRVAVFKLQGKAFAVTCVNSDDPSALALFNDVVSTIDLEGAP